MVDGTFRDALSVLPGFWRTMLDNLRRAAFLGFLLVPLPALALALFEVRRQGWTEQGFDFLARRHLVHATCWSSFVATLLAFGLLTLWRASDPRPVAPLVRMLGAVAGWLLFVLPLQRLLQPWANLLLLQHDEAPLALNMLIAIPISLVATTTLAAVAGWALFRLRPLRPASPVKRPRGAVAPMFAALLLAAAVPAVERTRPLPPPGSPNVVFVLVDTLRADRLGAYGYTRRPTSPRLDALAADSVLYEHAVSSAPWTTPSVSAIFTSRYPRRLGFRRVPIRLAPREVTLAELFQSRGYRTHAVVSNICASSAVGLDAGFEEMDESQLADPYDISSAGVTDRGLEWLRAHRGEPFLLYLHYLDPHFAYQMHPGHDFGGEYDGSYRAPRSHAEFVAGLTSMTPADVEFIGAEYDSEIAYTDGEIGRLLDGLRTLGLYDDALIVFTADHGEAINDRGDAFIGHGPTVYEELLHVPLLVKRPGAGAAGTRVREPVSTLDIAPTLAAAAGADWPAGTPIDGRPLGNAAKDRLVVGETRRYAERRAAYSGLWKLVVDRDSGARSLFDLSQDPGERHDLAEERAELASSLAARLDDWERELGEPLGEEVLFSPAQKERLEGLGYAQ